MNITTGNSFTITVTIPVAVTVTIISTRTITITMIIVISIIVIQSMQVLDYHVYEVYFILSCTYYSGTLATW